MGRVGGASVLCALVLLYFVSTISRVNADIAQYGLVIDAGSTGSRIFIYKWTPPSDQSQSPPVEEIIIEAPQAGRQSVTPGVSSFASDPASVGDSLRPLIEFAEFYVPKESHSATPLYLGATAGMRLLDVDQRESVMAEIRKYFSSSEVPFEFRDLNARVISGEEEGAYGWIQLNYAFETIGSQDAGHSNTYATLDLGGASTQITFIPSEDIMANIFPVVFNRTLYRLYTHSFLNFGMDRAIARSLDNLFLASNHSDVLRDPCYLAGYTEQIVLDGRTVLLQGVGDSASCRNLTTALLFVDMPCMNAPCSVQGVYQPRLRAVTYAMSSYYYYVALLGLTDETETWQGSVKDLEKVAQDFCKLSWDDAQKKYPKASASYLKSYCFRGSYIIALLNDGFHYPPTEKSLVFSNKVENTQMGWTLGLLLYQIQLVPVSLPSAENCDVVTAASQSGNTVYAVGVPVVALLGGLYLGWFVAKRSLLQSPKRVRGRDEKPLLSGYNV
mmetsp:Transcript_2937/g.5195  ORF Transcript_2937/g.5195 Transcript_2937/m.5195 type:complete len:500 (-) Transcript_2937:88-1587(-)